MNRFDFKSYTYLWDGNNGERDLSFIEVLALSVNNMGPFVVNYAEHISENGYRVETVEKDIPLYFGRYIPVEIAKTIICDEHKHLFDEYPNDRCVFHSVDGIAFVSEDAVVLPEDLCTSINPYEGCFDNKYLVGLPVLFEETIFFTNSTGSENWLLLDLLAAFQLLAGDKLFARSEELSIRIYADLSIGVFPTGKYLFSEKSLMVSAFKKKDVVLVSEETFRVLFPNADTTPYSSLLN